MGFGAGLARHIGGREQRPKKNLPGIELETPRNNSEHGVGPPIEDQSLPDGAWRAAEKSLPSGIAQHHGRPSVQVGRTKRAALRGGHPKYFEEARRDGFALRAAR